MKLILLKNAEKELDRIEDKTALKISNKLFLLQNNPHGLDSKKLEGGKGYRIRIGKYRVIYLIDKAKNQILIIKVAHRKDVYR